MDKNTQSFMEPISYDDYVTAYLAKKPCDIFKEIRIR